MKTAGTKRILCLFDYRATTGFATVSQNIVPELKRHFGTQLFLDIVPINYFGKAGADVVDAQERIMVPTEEEREKDPFCRYSFLLLLRHGDYDGYFVIQDPGVLVGMVPNLMEIDHQRAKAGRKKLRGLFYFPVDSPLLNTFFTREDDPEVNRFLTEQIGITGIQKERRSLGYPDRLITYTEFGRQEVLAKAPWLKPKLSVIPHGIDPCVFFVLPEEERIAFRQRYFGENGKKFLIINVNRNQFRKDIPTTLRVVKVWKDWYTAGIVSKPLFCYLHMHPHDPMGWDLRTVAGQLDLVEGEDYGFPPEEEQNAGSDPATLRGIYNAADVYVTTTTGEGWGLTVVEAMACGCPVVAPNHSSLTEIGGLSTSADSARFIAVAPTGQYCSTEDSVFRQSVDAIDVAQALAQLIARPRLTLQTFQAKEFAQRLTWRSIGHKWKAEFEQLFFK